jgi:uncharacterized protein YjlB
MRVTPRAVTIEEMSVVTASGASNNPQMLPIVYRNALRIGGHTAEVCAALFESNGWTGVWRNGIYAHDHFHSTAHEVLGIVSGSVCIRLGGETGETIQLQAGDVVVVPAGTAHRSEVASPDLLVVGAYPRGQSPDMCAPGAVDRELAAARAAAVPLPLCDPVFGEQGPLLERWRG